MGYTQKSIEWYKAKAGAIHHNKYSYEEWTEFHSYHSKIPIRCPIHGMFEQSLANHISRKAGCPTCRQQCLQQGTRTRDTASWLQQFISTHTVEYTYCLPHRMTSAQKITIKCPFHGVFNQRVDDHARGANCPRCASEYTRKTCQDKYGRPHPRQAVMSLAAMKALNDREWLQDQHHNRKQTLQQIAETLGVQDTTVGRYFKSHSIAVNRFPRSAGEQEIVKWFEDRGYAVITNDRALISPLELDIVVYTPGGNIVAAVEYCGLYWHSSAHKPDTYHIDKHDRCVSAGIPLITVFEDEWKYNKRSVENIFEIHLSGELSRGRGTSDRRTGFELLYERQNIPVMIDRTVRTYFTDGHVRSTHPTPGLLYHICDCGTMDSST